MAVSACKVVTSDSGLCNLVSCTDTDGLHEATISTENKRRRDALKKCVVHFFGFCANDGFAATIVLATEPFGATLSAALPPLSTHHAVIEDARSRNKEAGRNTAEASWTIRTPAAAATDGCKDAATSSQMLLPQQLAVWCRDAFW